MSRPKGFINSIGGFAIGKRSRLIGFSCAVRTVEHLVLAGFTFLLGAYYWWYRGSASVMVQT